MKRHDIYGRAHKALRALMADTMVALGRADLEDDCEARDAEARLAEMLAFCEAHARLENEFIHRALDERRPGASGAFAHEHARQAGDIEELRALAARRDPALHRRVAAFVAANLLHMEDEEACANALLHELFSDAELLAIERRLVASKPPGESMETLRWMLPAMSHPERVAMLRGMRQAPGGPFEAALAVARAHLPPREAQRLEEAV